MANSIVPNVPLSSAPSAPSAPTQTTQPPAREYSSESKSGGIRTGLTAMSKQFGKDVLKTAFPEMYGAASKYRSVYNKGKEENIDRERQEQKRDNAEVKYVVGASNVVLKENSALIRQQLDIQRSSLTVLNEIANAIKNIKSSSPGSSIVGDAAGAGFLGFIRSLLPAAAYAGSAAGTLKLIEKAGETPEGEKQATDILMSGFDPSGMNTPFISSNPERDQIRSGIAGTLPHNKFMKHLGVTTPPTDLSQFSQLDYVDTPKSKDKTEESEADQIKRMMNNYGDKIKGGNRSGTPGQSILKAEPPKPLVNPAPVANLGESSKIKQLRETEVKQKDSLTFEAQNLKFTSDKLEFDVEKLTINTQENQKSISDQSGSTGSSTSDTTPSASPSGKTPGDESGDKTPTPGSGKTLKKPEAGQVVGPPVTTPDGQFALPGESLKNTNIPQSMGGPVSPLVSNFGEKVIAPNDKEGAGKLLERAQKFGPANDYIGTLSTGASGNSLKALIDDAAKKAGIDPRIMYGIIHGESKRNSTFDIGDNGKSLGPFQLFTGGGLGNQFLKENPGLKLSRDTIPQQALWVAQFIKKNGRSSLSNWHGYRGDKDWNPKWGNAGYIPPETKTETIKIKPTERDENGYKNLPQGILTPFSTYSSPSTQKVQKGSGNLDLAFGDSTAAGLKLPGDSKVSRSPQATLEAIKKYIETNGTGNLKDKNILLSGVSNDPSEKGMEAVKKAAEILKGTGANVSILGGGSREDISKFNSLLEKYAKDNGIGFIPAGETKDKVHPDPKTILENWKKNQPTEKPAPAATPITPETKPKDTKLPIGAPTVAPATVPPPPAIPVPQPPTMPPPPPPPTPDQTTPSKNGGSTGGASSTNTPVGPSGIGAPKSKDDPNKPKTEPKEPGTTNQTILAKNAFAYLMNKNAHYTQAVG